MWKDQERMIELNGFEVTGRCNVSMTGEGCHPVPPLVRLFHDPLVTILGVLSIRNSTVSGA